VGRSLGKCNEAHLLPVDAVTTPLALICVLRGLSATAQGRVAPLIDSAPLPHDLPVESPAAQLVFWDLQAIASRPDSVVGWIMSTPEADAPTALPAVAHGSSNKGVISPPVLSPLLPGWMSLGPV
jgi:hypothetical protein